MKNRPEAEHSGYKTEEQLKEEAKRRAEEQARLAALRPAPSPKAKKAENFWYHYKWHMVIGVVVVALAVFFVRDVVLSTKPDVTILVVQSKPVAQESLDALQAALEDYAVDFNGDGNVSVLLDYIYLPPEDSMADDAAQVITGGQADYAGAVKLTATIMAGDNPLYLLDEGAEDYLIRMAAPSGTDEQGLPAPGEPVGDEIDMIFNPIEAPGAQHTRLPVSATVLANAPGCEVFGDTFFSVRPLQNEKKAEHYAGCLELLRVLAESE